ncbi:MAG: hypothetical protein M3Q19_14595 [Pseudomonadota bacterium]|nr:hypothetical protein [Pseudomonadota bacterium]
MTPAKGQSWGDLYKQADTIARQFGKGARAIDESRTGKPHIHLQLPGSNAALPPPPAGFAPLPSPVEAVPQPLDPYAQKMSPADAKRIGTTVPESYVEAARIKAVMHPHNSAPAPASLFTEPPMTPERELSNINRILAEGQGLPPAPPQQPRIGIGPAINAVRIRISGEGDDGTGETSQYVGGFFDELPQEVRQKLSVPQIEQYIALAKAKPTAQQLTDLFGSWGYDIHNADKIAESLAKGAKVNRSIRYEHVNRTNPDGAFGSGARGVADPFNFIDEMGAGFDTLGIGASGEDRPNVWNDPRTIGAIYDANVDANRSIIAADERNHPYARLGGQLASGIILPYGAGARTPGALAKLGAVEGFAAGLGAGEGNLIERLPNAAVGSAFGAGGGYTLGKAIDAGGALIGAARNRLLGSASPDATIARDTAYSAAPVVEDAAQAAGPTPASRFQPQGGALHSAADVEASAPPVPAGHVRLWKATNGRNYTTDLAGVALPIRNGRGGDLGYIDLPAEDLPLYAVNDGGSEFRLPTALAGNLNSVRLTEGSAWGGGSAAMRMDDGPPELVARQRDYINIPPPPPGFLPETSMLRVEDASRMLEVDEAAKGLNPEDVLPFAASAPDETASLATRKFGGGNGTRPIYQRGPVDLVGFVRNAGGLRDEGGDLRHLGIDNKPRDLEFAKGEGFLGGLVRDDGNSLDDMAEAAWEAGYFPEFHERPSVNDFLDALAETHAGHARRFLPDDLPEVARYQEELAQRHAMEAADAEFPALDKVGNIRLDKIESEADIARALVGVRAKIGDNPSLARVSHEKTAELAEQLGMTPEQFLKMRRGAPLSHAEAHALSNANVAALEDTIARARKALNGSEEDKAAFLRSAGLTSALTDFASGARAEAGRTLSQYRMVSKATKHNAEAIKRLVEAKGGHGSIDDMAQAIIDLAEDPAQANRFIQLATKPNWKDKAVQLLYFVRLSGIRTHAVNTISNTLTALGSLPEHASAAMIGQFRRSSTDRVLASELGPRLVGMISGAKAGLRQAKHTFKTGETSDGFNRIEANVMEPIQGPLGAVVRTPGRMLQAEDEFFKSVARFSELNAIALRRARGEGLKGDALANRVDELVRNPPADMLELANNFARYQTFQSELGNFGKDLVHLANRTPITKLVFPFIRTPINLFKYALERSLGAFALQRVRDDFKAGGARRDLAIARVGLGSSLGALTAMWAAQGLVTGGGPADNNERRLMLANGWQPYSIKVGDKYVSYERMDPLASTLGIVADYVEKQSAMTDSQREKVGTLLVGSIINNMASKTWMSGLADISEAIGDPARYGEGYVKNQTAGLAVPAASSQLAQTFDLTRRETHSIPEAIKQRIPGLSDENLPARNIWGEEIKREGYLGPDVLSPFATSSDRNDPLTEEMQRIGARIGKPLRDGMPWPVFNEFQRIAGQNLRQSLEPLVGSPEWRAMSMEAKHKTVAKLKKASREAAREAVGFGKPKKGEEATPPPPPGFVLPPPPPGFSLAQ